MPHWEICCQSLSERIGKSQPYASTNDLPASSPSVTWTPRSPTSPFCCAYSPKAPPSSLQNGQCAAKTLTMIGRPLKSSREMGSPSSVLPVSTGATGRLVSSSRGAPGSVAGSVGVAAASFPPPLSPMLRCSPTSSPCGAALCGSALGGSTPASLLTASAGSADGGAAGAVGASARPSPLASLPPSLPPQATAIAGTSRARRNRRLIERVDAGMRANDACFTKDCFDCSRIRSKGSARSPRRSQLCRLSQVGSRRSGVG